MFSTKKIRLATLHVSLWTLCSRMLGAVRTVLQIRYLGANAASDAFITAYKMPNLLRKIFAEGAISGIFVPTIIKTIKEDGVGHVNNLVTFTLVVVEAVVVLLCALVMIFPFPAIRLFAPGFSELQIADTVSCVRIVMPFIFFISSSAIFASALQAVGKFFMAAFAPVLLNIVFIASLVLCLAYKLPVEALCGGILVGGALQLALHIVLYIRAGFGFNRIRMEDMHRFGHVLIKFLPCLIGMGAMELGIAVDQIFTSYLPQGSTSLHEYAMRFMGIPLGVFASALSTVLLPYLSHVATQERDRLSFYLLETTKLVLWAMVPMMCIMGLLAHPMLASIFLSEKFTMYHVAITARVLQAFVLGLFFFAINKILLNIFYALHQFWVPAGIIIVSTVSNALFNWMLVCRFGVPGVALATTASAFLQTGLFYWTLVHMMHLTFDVRAVFNFLATYIIQVSLYMVPFLLLYQLGLWIIEAICGRWAIFFCQGFGYWVWVSPLCGLLFLALWYTRHFFNIKLHFLD